MPGRVGGRHKEVDAAFDKALVVVAEHRACQLFLEPIGKAPAVKLVLKCTIALVIEQACHDGSPWPDHLWNSASKFARTFEFSLIQAGLAPFILDRARCPGPFHCWAAIRESRVQSECIMGTIYEKDCPWVGDIPDVCTGDSTGAGAWQ